VRTIASREQSLGAATLRARYRTRAPERVTPMRRLTPILLLLGAACSADELTQSPLPDAPTAASTAITGNRVTPDTLRLGLGQDTIAACQPLNEDGNPLPRNCNWTSRKESIATVTGSGTRTGHITGRAEGGVWVVASAEKKKDSVWVIVGEAESPPEEPPPSDTTSPGTPTEPPPPIAGGCPSSGYLRLVQVSSASQLASALSNAQPGDQIRIARGTYSGAFSLARSGTATNQVVVCGDRPVLRGGQFRSSGSYVLITGLVFEGPIDGSTNQVYLYDAHHVRFHQNEIRFGDYHAGLSTDEVNHMVITSNYIHDNGRDNQHDHGIYFKTTTGSGNVIANNLLVRNAARGLSLHDNSGDGVYDVLVTHNTIVGNGSTGILVNDGDRMTVVNNISAYNGEERDQSQIRVLAGSRNVVRNNLTYSPSSGLAGIENITSSLLGGNLIGNPRFVVGYTDLRLQSGSPAIDLGLSEYRQDTDYAGRTRGSRPDAGAYEAQ
jgi:hypothetical protein